MKLKKDDNPNSPTTFLEIISTISILLFSILTLFLSYDTQAYGENKSMEKTEKHFCDTFSILTGCGTGSLKFNQPDYHHIHLGLKFGWELGENQERPYGKGATFFEIVPYINPVTSPSSEVEIGCEFLFKHLFCLKNNFYWYIEGGVGPVYLTKGTQYQSGGFNFNDQAGVGIQKFIGKNKAWWAGYSFRHLSNAGIKQPNVGIGTHSVLIGSTFYF